MMPRYRLITTFEAASEEEAARIVTTRQFPRGSSTCIRPVRRIDLAGVILALVVLLIIVACGYYGAAQVVWGSSQ